MIGENPIVSFPLSKITPEKELPGDIYLFVSGHFVCYKSAGDSISSEKFNLFILKKIQFLFIDARDLDVFNQWAESCEEEEITVLEGVAGKENKESIKEYLDVKKEVLNFLTAEPNDSDAQRIITKTRDFVGKMTQKAVVSSTLVKLRSYKDQLADHSTNVANISLYLAQSMGYTHQIILENIYLGAVLHDIGKTKIDPKVFEMPGTPAYDKAMMMHPKLGRNALSAHAMLPQEVPKIVAEHHEREDGRGFPKGIKGHQIYDLAKIVAIANFYDNAVGQVAGSLKDRNKKAIKMLVKEGVAHFDGKKLEKAVKALELVYN